MHVKLVKELSQKKFKLDVTKEFIEVKNLKNTNRFS